MPNDSPQKRRMNYHKNTEWQSDCHFPQLCAIIIPIPPATTKIPIVKKNQKNHWA